VRGISDDPAGAAYLAGLEAGICSSPASKTR
jgi:hypothetical protein